jgi:hypothetical protein
MIVNSQLQVFLFLMYGHKIGAPSRTAPAPSSHTGTG